MMGEAPPEDEATELTELELSAVGEAMNQMMAAAADATSAVLGTGGRDRPARHPGGVVDGRRAARPGTTRRT